MLERCETVVNVSCNTVADVETYALKEVEEMIETDSFTVEAATVNDYGELYEIGDKVTFRYCYSLTNITISDSVTSIGSKSLNNQPCKCQ